MYFFDTESIGFYGPTVLIQTCLDSGEPKIHNIFDKPVIDTLLLIEDLITHNDGLVGFNLAHDSFHLHRTYNVLAELPKMQPPALLDIHDIEQDCLDKYCLKPVKCLDLMLYGRRDVFQGTLNQKDIIMKKVPRILAQKLVDELYERVKVPDIYFAKSTKGCNWRILNICKETGKEIKDSDVEKIRTGELQDMTIDPDFVNVKLQFHPGTSLKNIAEKILNKEVKTLEDIAQKLPSPKEHNWFPASGAWFDVARKHLNFWKYNEKAVEYALKDPVLTREVYNWMGQPELGDDDSTIAFHVGGMHWKGFNIDIEKAKEVRTEISDEVDNLVLDLGNININSPVQVKKYLLSLCEDDMQKSFVPDSSKETLENLSGEEWEDVNPALNKACKNISQARTKLKEVDLFNKIIISGRFHASFKVVGTKTNRSAGGSESNVSRGGSINPQGIRKDKRIRSAFLLAFPDMVLSAGDFSGYEVSIAEAVFGDPALREALLSGKKFHAIFGSYMYGKTYEEVLATEHLNKRDPNGFYQRSKSGVFAWFYGAYEDKIAEVMWLTVEQTREGLKAMEETYPGIKRAREKIFEDFDALRQPKGIGTPVEWVEPKKYVESFLGFKRYFIVEFEIIRTLFDLANDLPDDWVDLGSNIRVTRRDRSQTGHGALRSALYAAAFNLQSAVERAASNHVIQSPGGQMAKGTQRAIIDIQPVGKITRWYVMPINIHDELEAPCHPKLADKVARVVEKKVEEYRKKVPLLAIDWHKQISDWSKV